jgi:HSP20 family molecular chaperone IbpA
MVASGQRPAPPSVFLPPADIYETHDSIVVRAEMPGVAPDGLDITPRALGADHPRTKPNQRSCRLSAVYNEYADGHYERVFTLSENIDRDRIEATSERPCVEPGFPQAESVPKIELKTS